MAADFENTKQNLCICAVDLYWMLTKNIDFCGGHKIKKSRDSEPEIKRSKFTTGRSQEMIRFCGGRETKKSWNPAFSGSIPCGRAAVLLASGRVEVDLRSSQVGFRVVWNSIWT